jgi:UMF1 family MFS transporter
VAAAGTIESPAPLEYSRKEQRGWYFYDFANSAFASTVVTLFLGPYLTELAKAGADSGGNIHPFGVSIDARSLWSYLVSLSVLLQVICLPIIGAIGDTSNNKKGMMALMAYIGSLATAAMFFLQGTAYMWGALLFLIANTAFGASIVIYNSFLPEIASPEERDAVSSKGWGIGYLGGGLLLALNLVLYLKAASFGISEGTAVRISLSSAGIWWAVFTIIPLMTIRNRPPQHRLEPGQNVLTAGFRQFGRTLRDMMNYPQTLTFLLAYLLYNDAIQTVITLSAQFGSDELKISMADLTMAILMVQFVAFAGAMVFNYLAKGIGAKPSVLVALIIWIAVLFAIYSYVHSTRGFFILCAVVAVILGGSQALSRSLFSLMIPKGREGEYFGLYEISDKGTSWLCPLLFGLALDYTKSYRTAILSLIVFFIAGFIILLRVDVRRAAIEAGNEAP